MSELNESKMVITIYGKKGDGKTTLALNPKYFDGKIAALSFDNKTEIIANEIYGGKLRIKIFSCIDKLIEDHDNFTTTAELQIKHIQSLLKMFIEKNMQIDWIIIDGLEIYTQIAEMAMRKIHNLKPSQGIANMNVWKDRKIIIKSLHRAAFAAANKGVIYTTYTEKDEIVEEGEIVSKKDIPKWLDVIAWETDIVIHTYREKLDNNNQYYADIISSKLPRKFKTGEHLNVTLDQ